MRTETTTRIGTDYYHPIQQSETEEPSLDATQEEIHHNVARVLGIFWKRGADLLFTLGMSEEQMHICVMQELGGAEGTKMDIKDFRHFVAQVISQLIVDGGRNTVISRK